MSEADQRDLDREALEAFVVENVDLERLESLLDRFNIFEAIGVVRQELRHSDFLAFLLNPQESHGLGDAIVKRLLQRALMSARVAPVPVTPIELSLWDLSQMVVLREWQHIDIFLLDEQNRLAVIIENKIDTGEHSDQLQRYYEIVEQRYPGYKIIGLYLTRAGEEPSHRAYLPLGYGPICEVLDTLAESQASVANAELQMLVTHYTQMLRRHIVGDSDIAKLCRQIYQKHKQALDLIYEHRPDPQADVRDLLVDLIKKTPKLVLETRGKQWLRFAFSEWDTPLLMSGSGWTSSGRMLLFEFDNGPDHLQLVLCIGPGPVEIRKKLFDIALDNQPPFQDLHEGLQPKWNWIYLNTILEPDSYEDASGEEREKEIRRRWAEFLEHDLPRIDAILKKESWIWEEPSGADNTV